MGDVTGSVLASIDDTLAGYDGAVSAAGGDMMRWSPRRVICDGGKPLGVGRAGAATIGNVTVTFVADAAEFSRQLTADLEACARAMRPVASSYSLLARSIIAAYRSPQKLAYSWHPYCHRARARCRTCNPAGNPLPLPGGREYNRRRRARQRRKARR